MDYVDRMAGRSARFEPDTLLKFTPLCARTAICLLLYEVPVLVVAWALPLGQKLPGAKCAISLAGRGLCRSTSCVCTSLWYAQRPSLMWVASSRAELGDLLQIEDSVLPRTCCV